MLKITSSRLLRVTERWLCDGSYRTRIFQCGSPLYAKGDIEKNIANAMKVLKKTRKLRSMVLLYSCFIIIFYELLLVNRILEATAQQIRARQEPNIII